MITLLLFLSPLLVAVMAAGWYRCRCRNRDLRRRISLQATAGARDRGPGIAPAKEDTTAARLREYLKLLDKVINTIPHPIYFQSDGDVVQGCNVAFARQIIGGVPAQVIGRRLGELVGDAPETVINVMAAQEPAGVPGRQAGEEITVACADGRERDFLVEKAGVTDADGTVLGVVGVLLDLTAKNSAAREQIAREKLQGVLETAGAVCHELNQPLQAITGYAQLLSAGIDPAHPDYPWIAKLTQDARRIAGITRKLQHITRYETCQYARGVTIVDLDRASGGGGTNRPAMPD